MGTFNANAQWLVQSGQENYAPSYDVGLRWEWGACSGK